MSKAYRVAVVGGGPAGLMAAEQLAGAGISVDIFDAMPSFGRKFLRAGIGGLNLTHSENAADFRGRYHSDNARVNDWLDVFDADDLMAWSQGLGVETFVGSSGRVFPVEKKAAPLLRRWLHRLRESGVTFYTRHRWLGFAESPDRHTLRFETPGGQCERPFDAVILALGGGSWSKLGSDGRWLPVLREADINCTDFRPSNCGFNYAWPADMVQEYSGQALKNIGLHVHCADGSTWTRKGDALISAYGLEGSLMYAASRPILDLIEQHGACTLYWDLLPDRSEAELRAAIARRKPKDSLTNMLRKQCHVGGAKLALLKALTSREQMAAIDELPVLLKAVPQIVSVPRPIDEAISTAGGVQLNALDKALMCQQHPGVFCAGEMLDWDAPTGGYLLTACFASGVIAGKGTAQWLKTSAD